jgi:hypothetical protein
VKRTFDHASIVPWGRSNAIGGEGSFLAFGFPASRPRVARA